MPDKITMSANDTKRYWFHAKRYGIGWQPSSWQGWVVVGAQGIFVLWIARREAMQEEFSFLSIAVPILISIVALILVCVRTGEPLRWRWGKK